MKYTVLGSSGFIGSHVARMASMAGHDVWCPGRNERLDTNPAGHLIYCIGMTADFRSHPHQTIDAHVSQLQRVLQTASFESLTYLSSTRVYQHTPRAIVDEESPLFVHPQEPGDLYNLSKLLGENLLLMYDGRVRVARLSNVIGNDVTSANFLFSVLRDCVGRGRVHLQQSLQSVKDYVDVGYVADLLLRLGPQGTSRLYNVASGINVSHQQIMDELKRLTGAVVTVSSEAATYSFPLINTDRVQQEFNCRTGSVVERLPDLVNSVRQHVRKSA